MNLIYIRAGSVCNVLRCDMLFWKIPVPRHETGSEIIILGNSAMGVGSESHSQLNCYQYGTSFNFIKTWLELGYSGSILVLLSNTNPHFNTTGGKTRLFKMHSSRGGLCSSFMDHLPTL